MFKKTGKLIAMLLIGFLLTGCWDAADVSTLNLSTMVILDRKGDELSFTLELAKISATSGAGGGGSGGGEKKTYLIGTGKSLSEARDDLDMQMDKPLFLGTVRALILTERAAANDLAEYLFRLRENQEYRQKVNIAIIQDDPLALMESENEGDQPIGFVIDDTIHTGQKNGHTCAVTTEKYVNDILANRGFIVQHIGLVNKQIKLDGYSVFRDAKLVGFIPMESSRGLSYLLSNRPIWVYRLHGDVGFVTVETELRRRKIKPSYQDGQIRFQVQLAFKATIQYKSDVSLFPLNEQNIQRYSEDLNQILAQEIRAAIAQSQHQFQSDYLDFGEAFRLTYPDEFERMDWMAEYPKAEVEVSTSIDISVSDKLDIKAS
ncbi:MAG: Ger(x)C family spore germination protein [Candidatus Pelethousia sp.]|nr:Ger(x)C family spore germination protein [Candidatus Pelethousia sp.]